MNPTQTSPTETEVTTQSTFATVTAPLHQPTSISKILAAVLFIILPFIGGVIGYSLALDVQVESVAVVNVLPGLNSASSSLVSTAEVPVGFMSTSSDSVYAVEVGQIPGNGRGYPVMDLYKKHQTDEPVKFASVGALNEYPIEFAVSPDKKKVAVNLETKLIIIDVETGVKEILFTPKIKIGGRITFSNDGAQVAFVDGSQYVSDSLVTLYTVDVQSKKVVTQFENKDGIFIDVDAWRPDEVIVLSSTAGKGCATPQYKLFDVKTKKLTTDQVPDFDLMNSNGQYVINSSKSDTPDACLTIESMCSSVYNAATHYRIFDPISNQTLGDFGENTARVAFVAMNPTNTAVIYKVTPWPKTELQCDDFDSGALFYSKDFETREIKPVTDLKATLAEWDITVIDQKSQLKLLTGNYRINSEI